VSLEEYTGFEGNIPEVEHGWGIRVLVGQGEYETERGGGNSASGGVEAQGAVLHNWAEGAAGQQASTQV
jgi:hypothetical protein